MCAVRRHSSLDFQCCGIKDVGKLTALLPELVHKTNRFNLEDNTLSAKSVFKEIPAVAGWK